MRCVSVRSTAYGGRDFALSELGTALLATFIIDTIVSLVALWWVQATADQPHLRLPPAAIEHRVRTREGFLLDLAILGAVWALLLLGRH